VNDIGLPYAILLLNNVLYLYYHATIVDKATKAYKRLEFATSGGFFYHINKKWQHVHSQFFIILVIL
jgi:hypothetical protein